MCPSTGMCIGLMRVVVFYWGRYVCGCGCGCGCRYFLIFYPTQTDRGVNRRKGALCGVSFGESEARCELLGRAVDC